MGKGAKKFTTMSVLPETLKEFASICLKTQSYDDLLKELILMKKAKIRSEMRKQVLSESKKENEKAKQ